MLLRGIIADSSITPVNACLISNSSALDYMTAQQPPDCCGAYGSSFLSTVPQTDGTMKSFVLFVYPMMLFDACETGIRSLSKSSLRRVFNSVRRRSLRSAIDCLFFLI